MSRPDLWEYQNPTRIIFGRGALRELPQRVSGRILLVTTPGHVRRGLARRVMELVDDDVLVHDRVFANPTANQLAQSIRELRGDRFDTIVALGGGSTIDSGKVLRASLASPAFDLHAALEAGFAAPSMHRARFVAVPTTAGTGSEVTPTATVWNGSAGGKQSIAGSDLLPDVALVDPELAVALPWDWTLGPGLDAYSQCFEAIWNRNATPVTTPLAIRGVQLVPDALRTLHADLSSLAARTAMAEAALLSGLAISQTRTALAHSMSYPVTAHLGLEHGLACALFLPAVLSFTLEVDDGRLALLKPSTTANELVDEVRQLFGDLGVADAVRTRIGPDADLQALAPGMLTAGRADNNLRPAELDDIRTLLVETEAWLRGQRDA
jgi:phosphonate metabolism-associated iron-containing alcohol dehydrogenase